MLMICCSSRRGPLFVVRLKHLLAFCLILAAAVAGVYALSNPDRFGSGLRRGGVRVFSVAFWSGADQVVPRPVGTIRDRELPSASKWGKEAFADVLESIDALVPPNASLREFVIAANLIVSRMDNGPIEQTSNWGDYLETGLRNGSCGRRALLLARLIRTFDRDVPLRFAGMASVPMQASHTTLEVWLDDQASWGWFDPSAGLFFTENGEPDGRILSQREVFADPSIVSRVGPWTPLIERVPGPPREVCFEGPIDELIDREPSFSLPNFPLQRMLELSTAWGSGEIDMPIPSSIRLVWPDKARHETARLNPDGSLKRLILRDNDRRLTWQELAGINTRGYNVVPVVCISGLTPGERMIFHVRAVLPSGDIRLRPLITEGGRLAKINIAQVEDAPGRSPVIDIRAVFIPSDTETTIVLMHSGDERNEKANILFYEVRPERAAPRSEAAPEPPPAPCLQPVP